MKLRHYSAMPTLTMRDIQQIDKPHFKPRGLWLSDDDCEDNWPNWCRENEYGLDKLIYAFDVTLKPEARILLASSPQDIALITRRYGARKDFVDGLHIRWNDIAMEYDGIIITPYQWEMRFDTVSSWYYAWDCASGCIWNAVAIAEIVISSGPPALRSAPTISESATEY